MQATAATALRPMCKCEEKNRFVSLQRWGRFECLVSLRALPPDCDPRLPCRSWVCETGAISALSVWLQSLILLKFRWTPMSKLGRTAVKIYDQDTRRWTFHLASLLHTTLVKIRSRPPPPIKLPSSFEAPDQLSDTFDWRLDSMHRHQTFEIRSKRGLQSKLYCLQKLPVYLVYPQTRCFAGKCNFSHHWRAKWWLCRKTFGLRHWHLWRSIQPQGSAYEVGFTTCHIYAFESCSFVNLNLTYWG